MSSSSDSEIDDLERQMSLRQTARSQNPSTIYTEDLITSIGFHTEEDQIAVGHVDGRIDIYDVDYEESMLRTGYVVHKGSCRALEFLPGESTLLSVSEDATIAKLDIESGKIIARGKDSHGLGFLSLKILSENECITGNDDGVLSLWDLRTFTCIKSSKLKSAGISCIDYASQTGRLAVTTYCGTAQLFDCNNQNLNKRKSTPEAYDSELTGCTFFKGESKVACSTGSGEILMFNSKGKQGDILFDSFLPKCINMKSFKTEVTSIMAVTDNIVLAGYEDGRISALYLSPNKFLGIIGSHSSDILYMDVNHDGSIVATAAREIKFWNISFLEDIQSMVGGKDKILESAEDLNRERFFSDLS